MGHEPQIDIARLVTRLQHHRGRRIPFRQRLSRCAVAVIIREHPTEGAQVLLIQRAQRRGDPWSGHMAFPGGRQQLEDEHNLATACRECAEETGLIISPQQCVGRLGDVVTRTHNRPRPMVITPYVFITQHDSAALEHCQQEVAATVWMPLSQLFDKAAHSHVQWQGGRWQWKFKALQYDGYRIWGLTLMMLKNLKPLLK